MKVIFHIGMGKTGTTSIQGALRDSQEQLAANGVVYLGMWLDMIDQRFSGLSGTNRFLAEEGANATAQAGVFHAHITGLHAASGAEVFILSNEALFENPKGILPFLVALHALPDVDLVVIGYLRNPADWLPSAYAQWGIKHKTVEGPIRPFANMAPGLLNQYEALRAWDRRLGKTLIIRAFDKSVNIIDDFSEALGIELEKPESRKLERDEWAELLLRREFNNLFSQSMLPHQFDQAIWGSHPPGKIKPIEDIARSISDQSNIEEALANKAELFDYIEAQFGIEFDLSANKPKSVDAELLHSRMLDYLMAIVVRQSKRIQRLELMIGEKRGRE